MSKTSLRKSFSSDLQGAGKRLAAGRQRLIIPLPTGLHRRRHASHFHADITRLEPE